MMIKKIHQIFTLLIDTAAFVKLKLQKPSAKNNNLLINFKSPQLYHRFFYLLIKFYKISGYKLYYPMGFGQFRNLRNKNYYLSLVVKEKNLLNGISGETNVFSKKISDSNFSCDYFSNYFEKNNSEKNCYHIPMSFHPLMYHKNLWNISVAPITESLNAVFCYGNFDENVYNQIHKTNFKINSRIDLLNFLEKKNNFMLLRNTANIVGKERQHFNEKFVVATKESCEIEMENIRPLLTNFNFYLCCPGVVMPLCHNIIEAISVGTIPILEKTYADVIYPPLEHLKNAIIFSDLEDLNHIIETYLFKFNKDEILRMKSNVLDYYQTHLTPQTVVNKIDESIINNLTVYLQAEHRSVKI